MRSKVEVKHLTVPMQSAQVAAKEEERGGERTNRATILRSKAVTKY